jgi:hypothetical protein
MSTAAFVVTFAVVPIAAISLVSANTLRKWIPPAVLAFTLCSFCALSLYYYGRPTIPRYRFRFRNRETPILAILQDKYASSWLVGASGLIVGVYFSIVAFVLAISEHSQRSTLLAIATWMALLVLVASLVVLGRSGISVYSESKTIECWWGLLCPLVAQTFRFDEFSRVSVHNSNQTCVWIRGQNAEIVFLAKSKDEATALVNLIASNIAES